MKNIYLYLFIMLIPALLFSQQQKPNYDESKIPAYTLPDPLKYNSGKSVKDGGEWFAKRRPQILSLFENEVYGKVPDARMKVRYNVVSIKKDALDGLAVRKLVDIIVSNAENKSVTLHVLLYIPNNHNDAVPAFLGLNFMGNQSVTPEKDIPITANYILNSKKYNISNHRADESTRGCKAYRWQVKSILKHGYALATCHYGDIDPDFDDGFQNGVHPLFYKKGQHKPEADEWGSIAAWAWGLSRILDYLITDEAVDGRRVAVIGHSRLGKTALWAGACDPRFAMVISNDSGCGGAALSKRRIGETVEAINRNFPHWFCGNFKKFNNNEDKLPLDQHMLIALMAPRPVYVASAQEDRWADPKGEFLSALNAGPVYRLLNTDGFAVREMPPVNYPIFSRIAYHIRSGKHDLTEYDWQQYLYFADKFLK